MKTIAQILKHDFDKDPLYLYDSNGNRIYDEESDGYWCKYGYDSNGNEIYFENSSGLWYKREYDSNSNLIYREDSSGYWSKTEYDSNSNLIYDEESDGYWCKYGYDSNGNEIYFETSDGYWYKRDYDDNGNCIYYENSDGYIKDNRPNEITQDKMSSKITQKIIADLVASDEKGLEEYGVTVDREDYTLRDWLQEAYEETCDTAKYLRAAIEKIDDEST